MRAAIYARYSSENQRESSIEDQVRLCRQEAERRGWTVTAVWQDAARSKAFDVLIVDDASRLSRDSTDAQITFKVLKFLGIKYVARSDGIDTVLNAKSSRFVHSIKAAMSEEFLRDLAEKTWRGLEGRARKGLSAGGLPYGYRSEPIQGEHGETATGKSCANRSGDCAPDLPAVCGGRNRPAPLPSADRLPIESGRHRVPWSPLEEP
jgi:DNA invertase Pin-like site-specific DNA recombinase